MTPGAYLQKRRAVAGHSIQSLEVELARVGSHGRQSYAECLRAQLRLIQAEEDTNYLSFEEAGLIGQIIPLDPEVYRQLVDIAERRATGASLRICAACGATETLCAPCSAKVEASDFGASSPTAFPFTIIEEPHARAQIRSV